MIASTIVAGNSKQLEASAGTPLSGQTEDRWLAIYGDLTDRISDYLSRQKAVLQSAILQPQDGDAEVAAESVGGAWLDQLEQMIGALTIQLQAPSI